MRYEHIPSSNQSRTSLDWDDVDDHHPFSHTINEFGSNTESSCLSTIRSSLSGAHSKLRMKL